MGFLVFGPFSGKEKALVGACLATADRIFATGSDTVSKCVLQSCACFRAYSRGLKGHIAIKRFCDPIFHLCLYCKVGSRVVTGSCDPVSRRLLRQLVPTTEKAHKRKYFWPLSPPVRGGGVSQPGGHGSKIYGRSSEPKEHNFFCRGTIVTARMSHKTRNPRKNKVAEK